MAGGDKLNIFVSSTMTELRDVRDFVRSSLEKQDLIGWVYEADAGAGPESVRRTCFEKLKDADVYLGLFATRLGPVTEEEYFLAREEHKPRFLYVRKDGVPEPALESFLREQASLAEYVHCASFDKVSDLARQVPLDILAWLVREQRKAARQYAETKSMREDENERFEQAKRGLEEILRLLERALEKDGELLNKLRAAQQEWEGYRTANAVFMADWAREGTLGRLLRISSMADLTKARTADLWKTLGF